MRDDGHDIAVIVSPPRCEVRDDKCIIETHLLVSDGCAQMGYQHIGRLIHLFGAAIAREAYTEQAVLSMVRMHKLVMTHVDEADSFTREASVNAVADFVYRTAPYLIYRSVLTAAVRAQGHIMRFVSPEVRATEKWKVYEEQFGKMVGLYELPKVNTETVCDSSEVSLSLLIFTSNITVVLIVLEYGIE